MSNNKDLVIMALQQRIGQIVSDYELQIATLRAAVTVMTQEAEDNAGNKENSTSDNKD